MSIQKNVVKYILSNGLTVLIHQKKSAPKVALQMWYNVGSKHEKPGEKGMAHFLEHMVFKGTNQMLSESDINMVTQKIAADANAFTSFDYTAYVFDVPVANWAIVLPIFADCMQNCSFTQEHMNSEVKAVIQELKMYRDQYKWALAECLVTNLFESHPYHYPIIGYKQDLWSLQRETFLKFYQRYYVPSNAALVIVGDVEIADVLAKVEQAFKNIARSHEVQHEQFFHDVEFQAKSVTMYRDTQQAYCSLAFLVPGAHERKDFMYDVVGSLLANGKSSRLHKILVDELELVNVVAAYTYDLFDHGVYFIDFKPKHEKDIEQIKQIILQEIEKLATQDIPDFEIQRAVKFAQLDYQHMLEDTHKQAYAIGRAFTCFKDETYPFNYCNFNEKTLKSDVQTLLQRYFKRSLCNDGRIINVAPQDRDYMAQLQQESDELDSKILQGKERETEVEQGRYVHQVQVQKYQPTTFPAPEIFQLENGLKVLWYRNDDIQAVECMLRLKADSEYDPDGKEGVGYLTAQLMLEGTKKYPGLSFAQIAESHGLSISSDSGMIKMSMLASESNKGFELLGEILQSAQLEQSAFNRVKDRIKSFLLQFWDNPQRCIRQVAAAQVYGNHPYGKMATGTQESLDSISLDDVREQYKNYVTPREAVLVIVGNFDPESLQQNIADHLGSWSGSAVADIVYPAIVPTCEKFVEIEKQRDQVVMAFAGLSVPRFHPDYDGLCVFNQLLVTGMNSKLFELREQSGLFYTIGGSLTMGCGKQPGMMYIRTIVSKDRVAEAQQAIVHCLQTAIDTITQQEFDEAKEMLINEYPSYYETFEMTVSTLSFLDKYNLPSDYYVQHIQVIRDMKLEDMKQAVKRSLDTENLICIKIGRL